MKRVKWGKMKYKRAKHKYNIYKTKYVLNITATPVTSTEDYDLVLHAFEYSQIHRTEELPTLTHTYSLTCYLTLSRSSYNCSFIVIRFVQIVYYLFELGLVY